MNFLTILKLVLQLLPLVLECVKVVETHTDLTGNGAAKFALVKGLLTDTAEIGTDIDKSQYNAAIEKAINLAVTFFNATGVFKKA